MLGHSQTWITYNYICVGVAYAMLSMSLFLMPINLATKGYVGMGIISLRLAGNTRQNAPRSTRPKRRQHQNRMGQTRQAPAGICTSELRAN